MVKNKTVEEIIEDFIDLLRRGEYIDINEFATAYPEHSAELLEMLPLISDMEKLNISWAEDDVPDLRDSDFKLLKKIGCGGMGSVYEAEQISLGRKVAVKILSPRLFDQEAQKEQFIAESKIISQLHHPHIIKVIDAKCSGMYCYYAMELLNGKSLDMISCSNFEEVAIIGVQASEALDYIHSCGVLHRDIKPANLFLDENNFLHLGDFGLSVLQDKSSANPVDSGGTLRYMAPERLAEKLDSPQSDIYSLGATLYELAFQRPLFIVNSSAELSRAICSDFPEIPTGTPLEFAAILKKCLCKLPEQRYCNASELTEDLKRFINKEPVQAAISSCWRRLYLWKKRKPAAAIFAFLAFLGIIGAFSASVIGYCQNKRALHKAEHNAQLADMTLEKVFKRISELPSSKQNNQLLKELLPYYQQIARNSASPDKQIFRANMIIGKSALKTGDYITAENAFRKAAEIQDRPDIINLLAFSLKKQGKVSQADTLYEQTVAKYEYSANPVEKIEAVRACLEHSQVQTQKAFGLLEELFSDHPQNPEYRFLYAKLLGENPRLYRKKQIAGIAPQPFSLLIELTEQYPDNADYGKELLKFTLHKLNFAPGFTRRYWMDITKTIDISERLLWNFPNEPEIISNVIELQLKYIELQGQKRGYFQDQRKFERLLTILEVLFYNPEISDTVREKLIELQFKRANELDQRFGQTELLQKISKELQFYHGKRKNEFQKQLNALTK